MCQKYQTKDRKIFVLSNSKETILAIGAHDQVEKLLVAEDCLSGEQSYLCEYLSIVDMKGMRL